MRISRAEGSDGMKINPSVPAKVLTFFFIVCVNVHAFGNEMSKFRFRLILLCILFSLAFFHWSSARLKMVISMQQKNNRQARCVWAYHECKHYQIWYKKQLHPFRNWVATNEQMPLNNSNAKEERSAFVARLFLFCLAWPSFFFALLSICIFFPQENLYCSHKWRLNVCAPSGFIRAHNGRAINVETSI